METDNQAGVSILPEPLVEIIKSSQKKIKSYVDEFMVMVSRSESEHVLW